MKILFKKTNADTNEIEIKNIGNNREGDNRVKVI